MIDFSKTIPSKALSVHMFCDLMCILWTVADSSVQDTEEGALHSFAQSIYCSSCNHRSFNTFQDTLWPSVVALWDTLRSQHHVCLILLRSNTHLLCCLWRTRRYARKVAAVKSRAVLWSSTAPPHLPARMPCCRRRPTSSCPLPTGWERTPSWAPLAPPCWAPAARASRFQGGLCHFVVG